MRSRLRRLHARRSFLSSSHGASRAGIEEMIVPSFNVDTFQDRGNFMADEDELRNCESQDDGVPLPRYPSLDDKSSLSENFQRSHNMDLSCLRGLIRWCLGLISAKKETV